MARFVAAARVEDVPAGTAAVVEVEGHVLALVHAAGGFFALDNECPHAGGPLGEGELVGPGSLQCPWHGAVFELDSGGVVSGPAPGPARTHPVKVEGGIVWVAIEPAPEAAGAGSTPAQPTRPLPAPNPEARREARTPPTTEEEIRRRPSGGERGERLARLRALRQQAPDGKAGGPEPSGKANGAGAGGGRRRQGGQGQWALGYYEPLNEAERVKRDQDGLDVYERLSVHAKGGFASIPKDDLATRYRWYGLYTQRPEEDGYFMMRVRVPNGVLSAQQVEAVGRISQRFGRNICDVTDRQNFQFHWVRIEDVPEIWARLGAVGLTTEQFGPEYGVLVELLGEIREELIREREVDFATWARRWKVALDHDLLGLVTQGRGEEAKDLVRRILLQGDGLAPRSIRC